MTTATYKEVVESSFSNIQMEKMRSEMNNKEVKLEIEALIGGVRGITIQEQKEDDSGDERTQEIEAQLLEELSDDEMQDIGSNAKTEEEAIREAWAACDAALAEDAPVISEPDPRPAPDVWRMPQSRMQEKDIADDLTGLTTDQAKFIINLNVCFDVSSLPRHLQSQNMHYDIDARNAATVNDLFSTLWMDYVRYNRERLCWVRRLEVTLPIIEDNSVKDVHSWSIKGDFNAQEQQNVWKDFLEAAKKRGRLEASAHQRKVELQEKTKRLRCVKDHLGNFYDSNGDYWRPRKWLVHAQIEAKIVLCFD